MRYATLVRSTATAAALLLLVLVACAQPSAPPPSWLQATPPAELARFSNQELTFGEDPCVADLVAHYLIDLQIPPADARCVL